MLDPNLGCPGGTDEAAVPSTQLSKCLGLQFLDVSFRFVCKGGCHPVNIRFSFTSSGQQRLDKRALLDASGEVDIEVSAICKRSCVVIVEPFETVRVCPLPSHLGLRTSTVLAINTWIDNLKLGNKIKTQLDRAIREG
eukprot:s397_g17.t1